MVFTVFAHVTYMLYSLCNRGGHRLIASVGQPLAWYMVHCSSMQFKFIASGQPLLLSGLALFCVFRRMGQKTHDPAVKATFAQYISWPSTPFSNV